MNKIITIEDKMVYSRQRFLRFFNADNPPSSDLRRKWANPSNPDNPFHQFIGNANAVKLLSIAVFSAYGSPHHDCADSSFALLGPSSSGKTTMAKMFAKAVRLPFVELQPQQLKQANDVLVEIGKVLETTWVDDPVIGRINIELIPGPSPQNQEDKNYIVVPPCVVFIDEVHALKRSVVDALLKATEPKDRVLVTEGDWTADTSHVCWIIATTEEADLFDAFLNRFDPIQLNLYTREEIGKIIWLNNQDWSGTLCAFVALYCGFVPREALNFAKKLRKLHEMNGGDDWVKSIEECAEYSKISLGGMTEKRLGILTILGQHGPIAAHRLPALCGIKDSALRKCELPPLQTINKDQPMPLITTSSQGYTITPAGLYELDQLHIENIGNDAISIQVREQLERIYASMKEKEKEKEKGRINESL